MNDPGTGDGVLCCRCQHWKALHFDGWQWKDLRALCEIDCNDHERGHRCHEEYALPHTTKSFAHKVEDTAVIRRQLQGDDLTTAMEEWYEKNKLLFDSVATDATEGTRYTKQEGDLEIDWDSLSEEDARIARICLQPANSIDHEKLFKHQQEDFWRYKDEFEDGIFLEQGCGKSAIILRVAAWLYLHKQIDSLLVVAPNDVHRQWAIEQIPVWLPPEVPRELQLFGGRGGSRETYPFRFDNSLHIVSVNIDTFSTPHKWEDIAMWVKCTKCFVVLDEATCIKNVSAKRTQRMLYEFNDVVRRRTTILSSKVRTVGRAILTGTPATNGVTDFWSLMEFLRPNYFGRNWYSFRQRYAMLATIDTPYGRTQILLTPELWEGIKGCDTYDKAYMLFGCSADTYETVQMQSEYKGAYKHEEELRELIKPVSVFRLLKDCTDMPEQVYHKKSVTMSDEQERAYRSMEAELLAMYGGATTTAANKLSAIIRLSHRSGGLVGRWHTKARSFISGR